ncbi:MAG: hypothetical protein M3Y35_17695 [Actinomycetota bacterium]|nr:hypothetical protein [Actinomycetota bacterium]
MADFPHFAHPFARNAQGKVKVVEQDTPEHILSCETVIATCPLRFRLDRPEFGIPWPEFRTAVDGAEIRAAMQALEPRSTLAATAIRDLADTSKVTITIEVPNG